MMKYHQKNLLLFLLTSMHHHQSLQMKFGATFTLANSQKFIGLTSDDITSSNISSSSNSSSDGIMNSANNANSINSQNLNMNSIFANQLIQHLNEKLQIAGLYNNNNNNNSINLNNNNNINNINNSGVAGGIINPIFHHELMKNQIILNGSEFADETWRKQMEYDKFMNEIWIGVVLTLIIISLVFCVCSCFLYHQFRQWQINYRHNMNMDLTSNEIESVKLNLEDDDPVPQYTLVSGLPSYETALDMLQKSTTNKSCIIVYPSVFNIFTKNEKDDIITTISSSSPSSPIDAISTTTAIPSEYNRKSSIEKSRNSLTIIPKYDQIDNENLETDEEVNSSNSSNISEALLDRTNFHKNP